MTGTRDTSPIGGLDDPKDRKLPYQHSTHANTYLIVFDKGDHMIFSGRGRGLPRLQPGVPEDTSS